MFVEFTLNGEPVGIDVAAKTPLLEALRNDTPVASIAGKSVTTLEGLGSKDNPHPLQTAFINEQAIQCGYCASGIIVTAAALLQASPSPLEDEIKDALAGHLCRCGAQPRMLKAIARAAVNIAKSEADE